MVETLARDTHTHLVVLPCVASVACVAHMRVRGEPDLLPATRGGNRAGRAGPTVGRANNGPGQNRADPKLARFFRAKILTAQPALKIGPVGPNSFFKAKKNSGGPGQILPDFFRANNLMAQPGPNFGRTGLAHRIGPILPPLPATTLWCVSLSGVHWCGLWC